MKKIAALATAALLTLSACAVPAPTVEAIAPESPVVATVQDTRGDMYVPEVMGDPYYSAGDVFEVTDDGYLYMVGTGFEVREDVDWFVMQGTFPTGFYVLENDGALVPVQAWQVSPSVTLA